MKNNIFFILLGIIITCCTSSNKKQFKLIPSSQSGIHFRNTLKEEVDFNIFNYMYFYNGAGVGVGDFNGDGLVDLYFTSNQQSNKLYLNKGGLQFNDVSVEAGVEGFDGWATGISVVDINADGLLDIYVSYLGQYLIYNGKNQLFINEGNNENGIPIFNDKALEYGLDLIGFSTQSVFFDYDKDGDLDMFMLNHSLHQNGTFGKSTLRQTTHPLAGDRLLRNDDGHFIDATARSGIYSSAIGYGLGVVVSDVNLDGWPDIYVGNDFHENDYLYINQGDGTFQELAEESMMHTSRYTMGMDLADFNNDGFSDLIAVDMLPSDPQILKASQAEDAYDVYNFKIQFGYSHQYARNVFQVNNQDGTFSDIALMGGIAATDWSWSGLLADFDLDGSKDIFISNGILRRSNDLDYINFITIDSIQMKITNEMGEKELSYIYKMPQIKVPNALFINNKDSTFSNKANDWGLGQPSYSNGTAFADFDNDGDLDIAINNIEDEAFLYENMFRSDNSLHGKHYVQFQLRGSRGNIFGFGTKIFLYADGKQQMMECMPTRGYMSSVEYRPLFGLDKVTRIDSVIVIWPDDKFQVLRDINADKTYYLKQDDADGTFNYNRFHNRNPIFKQAIDQVKIDYKHKENKFVEFNREQLIPHMFSQEGPAVAIGDVNNDGTEDIFLGGGKWQPASLYLQETSGQFKKKLVMDFEADSTYEDVDAVLFDADNDNDLDLFVVSGGNEFTPPSKYCQSRLYLNDGDGNFSYEDRLPPIFLTGSTVAINDIEGDGDIDIFLGARTTPWNYGIPPDSYLLLNDGKGNFVNVTDSNCPSLKKFGFIKQAIWADMNSDGSKDLVIASEWSPISIFLNRKGKLELTHSEQNGLSNTSGWWNTILPEDIDGDGDIDLVAGNLGLNSKLKASINQPVCLYVSDFDKNDQVDQVLTHFINGREYPFHTRDELTKQMPGLKKKFLSYQQFSKATVDDVFSRELLANSKKYSVQEFRSSIIRNLGNMKFRVEPLPMAAQITTVNAIMAHDFNGDSKMDFLMAGNFYPINIQLGRNDSGYGLLLMNNEKNNLKPIPAINSGFSIKGEVRYMRTIKIKGKDFYLMIRNNNSIEVFTIE